MFSYQRDAGLVEDREDLIAVLQLRFGFVPGEIIEQIYEIEDMNTLQRLILAAANAAGWSIFMEEFKAGRDSFRLLGENFNPLRDRMEGRVGFDGKAQE